MRTVTVPVAYGAHAMTDLENYEKALTLATKLALAHVNDVWHARMMEFNDRLKTEPWHGRPTHYADVWCEQRRCWWHWSGEFLHGHANQMVSIVLKETNGAFPATNCDIDMLFYQLYGRKKGEEWYECYVCMPVNAHYMPSIKLFPGTDGYWYERTDTGIVRTFL